MSQVANEKNKKSLSERILTFDIMRGYFLFVILFNHLQYYPSGLELFTGRGILYVSTAEGFFVVSGIVLGIVRGRKLLDKPFKEAAKLLWKRSLQLYITNLVLTIFFALVGAFFMDNPGLKSNPYTDWDHWWNLILSTATLNYTYGWADFLRLYTIFLFLAPVALWLLRKGWWYILLIASAAAWALYPVLPPITRLAQPFSWQFIFFAGFTIGFYWQPILAKWRTLSISLRKKIGWTMVTLFFATLLGSAFLVYGHLFGGSFGAAVDSAHHIIEQGFNKDRLPIPRILLGTIWFWGLFYLVRRFEKQILQKTGTVILGFGVNSLYTYIISAFVIFFLHLLIAPPGLHNIILNFILSAGAAGLVQLAVHKKFLMNIIPR